MVQSLGNIRNPLLRSLTGAIALSAAVTMITGTSLISAVQDRANAYKISVLVGLVAAGGGGVLGILVRGKRSTSRASSQPMVSTSKNHAWQDWRDFKVTRKVKESEEITSFYLEPVDRGPLPDFQPGQFLTIKLEIPGQPRPVIRTYSLSDYSPPHHYYRLSIKREGSPHDLDVPPGIASNFMHDQVQEGRIIPAKPPNGKFYLDLTKRTPAILISNGVGITPMISMAKAASHADPEREVWFLHGARNHQYQAFREPMLALAEQTPHLQVHYRYSRPRPEDEGLYNSVGYIDAELIKSLVAPALQARYGSTEAEYFLCGSPAFMDSLRAGLTAWGVAADQIKFESFSKPQKAPSENSANSATDASLSTVKQAEVTFAKSGQTVTWTPKDGTLLEFAEANGLEPAYSCRAGVCLTCMCAVQEGEVVYGEDPAGTPDEGSALICVSKPKTTKLVLNL